MQSDDVVEDDVDRTLKGLVCFQPKTHLFKRQRLVVLAAEDRAIG
jgi:hypothetical protein